MYTARIKDNKTGEEVDYLCNDDWDEVGDFLWVDGNYACDCNRHLFFNRAKGINNPDENCGCGDERYTVLYVKLPNGVKIPIDTVESPWWRDK